MAEQSPALFRSGSGEPVLLLHGFTGTWRHWEPLLASLGERYEVIAPTLVGHDGAEPYPSERAVTMSDSADSLEKHLDAIGVGSAHVVGNSMGGALALELAKRGRARSVVALAPAGGWSAGDGEALRLARFFSRQMRLTRAIAPRMDMLFSRPRIRRVAFRELMRHGEAMSCAAAVGLARASLRCTVAERAIAALRADEGLALSDLDRIECPVLLVSPQHDRVLPPARHAPRFRREIPGVEARTLPGCGHVPMWDDTPLVLRTIGDFVDVHTQTVPGEPERALHR